MCSGSAGRSRPVTPKLYVDGFAAAQPPPPKAISQGDRARVYTGSFSDDSLMATARRPSCQETKADVLTGSSQSVVGAIGVAEVGSPGVVRHAVS